MLGLATVKVKFQILTIVLGFLFNLLTYQSPLLIHRASALGILA